MILVDVVGIELSCFAGVRARRRICAARLGLSGATFGRAGQNCHYVVKENMLALVELLAESQS